MKKAAIITLSLSDNYGAVLQTYALSRALTKLNVEATVYNYNDDTRFYYGMSPFSRIKHHSWRLLSNMITGGKKRKAFAEFRERYIPLTSKRYHNNNDLRLDPGRYDVYISGSDQIWNPDIFMFDRSYFLDFVPAGSKKISYASSFARQQFPEGLISECKELLGSYEAISVREKSGVRIVDTICGKKAVTVLDPTLLLEKEDWSELTIGASSKAKSFRGILCYVMPGDSRVENEIEKIAQQLHARTKLPIMRLGVKEYKQFRYGNKGCDLTATPADFLEYFMNAEYVVTNSFHGTAFSINFGKKFYVIENSSLDENAALFERMNSLLEQTEATKAIIRTGIDKLPEEWPIDLTESQRALKELRDFSIDYLKNNL